MSLTFVAENATPVFIAAALPRPCAEAVLASRIRLTFVTSCAFIAVATLANTWSFARSVDASLGTNRLVAVLSTPSGLANLLASAAAGVVAEEIITGLTKYGAG